MELTKIQSKKIGELRPIARKPAKVSNYKFMYAMFHIIENGCKWRALPKKYGEWHTVYVKFNRWAKNGTIAKVLLFSLKAYFSSHEETKTI